MKKVRICKISYRPGYSDMMGGYHEVILNNDTDKGLTYVCRDRQDHMSPNITTVYAVSDESFKELEDFIFKNNIMTLEDRPKSNMFATDYSPWSWSIDYETKCFGEVKKGYCRIEEYKMYRNNDFDLLNELRGIFVSLRGEKISETTEEK